MRIIIKKWGFSMRCVIVALMTLFIFFTAVVNAHPAEDLILKYDRETGLLSIRVLHESKNFDKHYIEKVWVSVNKKKVVIQEFTSQDDLYGLTLQYKIFNLKKGDIIKVDTRCNIFGEKSKTLAVE